MKDLLRLFAFSLLALAVFSCKCAPEGFHQTREDAIRDNWGYSRDVFAARVEDQYCKCYPQSGSFDRLNCIHIKKDARTPAANDLVSVKEQELTCQSGEGFRNFYYQDCDYVQGEVKALASVSEVTTSPVTIDNTNKPSCGISDDIEEATNANGCDLTHQPCFYTLTVTNVFKGNLQIGQVLNSSGPDVLTSCGSPKSLLQVGQTYMVGLGSVCSLIKPWRPLTEFTSNDLNFIQKLNQEKPNQEGRESEEKVAKMAGNDNNNNNDNNNDENWMEVNKRNLVDDTGAWSDRQENGKGDPNRGILIDDTGAWPDMQDNRDSNDKPVFVDDTGAWPEVNRDNGDENTQWYDKTDIQQGSNENEIKDLDKELEN
ncbi:PREDICTED: uncharacterized protein LOC100636237 isoform X2 [Amphimedon queenslandica]|uniref:NTR domain-containing protein n=1 Tax=Amphimedon queenslandica TaxID=400682 RepID=A0AAN0IYL3_AMPQE|nr:PREDICTED: uncharacterized protein LOC100636237 isoform X2 [Amphimedon queenslandica]|eukprot:XP_019849854.1 PREDICTED: uncharacterized protein LOC100636237 isoform X2 [Amphimedon queenslandica]